MIVPNNKIYQVYSHKTNESNISPRQLYAIYSQNEPAHVGYQNHSAFKVKVKPRQALASVNMKLAEQRNSAKRYTPITYDSKITEQDEFDYEQIVLAQTPTSIKDEIDNDLNILNRDAFRPSAVIRRNKTHGEFRQYKSSSAKIQEYNHSKDITDNKSKNKTNCSSSISHFKENEAKFSSQITENSLKSKRVQKRYDNNSEGTVSAKDSSVSELKIEDYLDNTAKMTVLDIFNEAFFKSNFSEKKNSRFKRGNKDILIKNLLQSDEKKKSDFLNKLGEEEFIKFLKDYRKNKNFNITDISYLSKTPEKEFEKKKSFNFTAAKQIIKIPSQNIITINDTFGILSSADSPSIATFYQFNNTFQNSKQTFLANYLNTKILKSSKRNEKIIFDEKNRTETIKSKTPFEYKDNIEFKIINHDQSIQKLKILNFPDTVN